MKEENNNLVECKYCGRLTFGDDPDEAVCLFCKRELEREEDGRTS